MLLKWVDEIAYIRVSLDFPGQHFVTIGLDNVEFKHPIREGQILRFECAQTRVGNSLLPTRSRYMALDITPNLKWFYLKTILVLCVLMARGRRRLLRNNRYLRPINQPC
jgi:hypothetical protein